MSKRNWSRDELILAFNLYCKTPFGRIHNRNPEIMALAKLLGRTPSAVSWKLANFARLDPALKNRNISGASHGGKGEIDVWNEFNADWEKLGFESEKLLAAMSGISVEELARAYEPGAPREGKEREAVVRMRVNQGFFRLAVLAAYDGRCCITGLAVPELLVASHIIPWSAGASNRVNPRNGLCMNALHDRAFDRGLITVTSEFKVIVSPLLKSLPDPALKDFLLDYDSRNISLPDKFIPDIQFLKYHNTQIFKA